MGAAVRCNVQPESEKNCNEIGHRTHISTLRRPIADESVGCRNSPEDVRLSICDHARGGAMTGFSKADHVASWQIVNVSPFERAGRQAIGVIGTIVGAALLSASSSILGSVLEIVLVGFGLDMLFTGTTGHSPFYLILGRVLRPQRSTHDQAQFDVEALDDSTMTGTGSRN